MSNLPASKPPGKIITFYSYKGGTGRSMILANVAYMLATQHRHTDSSAAQPSRVNKVLMIDWDLEAPGLYRYFEEDLTGKSGLLGREEDWSRVKEVGGLMDLLEVAARSYRERFPSGGLPESKADTPEAAEIFDSIIRKADFDNLLLPMGEMTNLFMLTAGREDAPYQNSVRTFDWEHFYRNYGSFFTRFRQRLIDLYDYVLIDSRTGLTDAGGICTRVMPEKLVGVFAPNRQNIEGLTGVFRRAIEFRRNSRDPRGLVVFPVASRIDSQASKLRRAWWTGGRIGNKEFVGYEKIFEDLFVEMFDLDGCDLNEYFDATQVPHDSDYAYGEEIAARVQAAAPDKLSIGTACANLTERLVTLEAPWERPPDPKLKAALREEADRIKEELEIRRRRRFKRILSASLLLLALITSMMSYLLITRRDYVFIKLGIYPSPVVSEVYDDFTSPAAEGKSLDNWTSPAGQWQLVNGEDSDTNAILVSGQQWGLRRMPSGGALYDYMADFTVSIEKGNRAAWVFRANDDGGYVFELEEAGSQVSLNGWVYSGNSKILLGRRLIPFTTARGDRFTITSQVKEYTFNFSIALTRDANDSDGRAANGQGLALQPFTDPNRHYRYGGIGFLETDDISQMKVYYLRIRSL